jgi:hypothetical protein
MDRSNDGVPKPAAVPPSPVAAEPLRVTPDNVVALAVLFRHATNRLWSELALAENALKLSGPWMDDPASEWMREFFDEYFLKGENSFVKVLQAIHDQHKAHADALQAAVAEYGKLDELGAARAEGLKSYLDHRFPSRLPG